MATTIFIWGIIKDEKITKSYIVKTWEELTEEEKEKQKDKHYEFISQQWCEMLYDDFRYALAELKKKLKYICFDDVYVDENSQGWWIDRVVNATCYIGGKTTHIYDIDFRVCKYIEELTSVEIDNEWENFEELKQRKGYKTLAKKLEQDFEIFKNGVNDIVQAYFDNLYYINDEFIDMYFEGVEFEFLETEEV